MPRQAISHGGMSSVTNVVALVAARQRTGMEARVDEQRDLRDDERDPARHDPPPALSRQHDREREREQRGEQPPAGVHVGDRAEGGATGIAVDVLQRSSRLARSTARSASTRKSGSIATSKATRPSSKSHGVVPASTTVATATDGRACAPIREPPEEEHGSEHADRCEPARDLAVRPGDDGRRPRARRRRAGSCSRRNDEK